MLSLLRLESQEKDFLKLSSNSHITPSFLSCSYSFEIETINTFICIHSLENHNRIHSLFRLKPYLWGGYIPIGQIWGSNSPPPGGGGGLRFVQCGLRFTAVKLEKFAKAISKCKAKVCTFIVKSLRSLLPC